MSDITIADIKKWDLDQFDEVCKKLVQIDESGGDAASLLKNQEVFNQWGGASARAAHGAVVTTSAAMEENSKKAAVLKEVCRLAEENILACKEALKDIERDCMNYGLNLNEDTNTITLLDSAVYTPEQQEVFKAEVEKGITTLLALANKTDEEIAEALDLIDGRLDAQTASERGQQSQKGILDVLKDYSGLNPDDLRNATPSMLFEKFFRGLQAATAASFVEHTLWKLGHNPEEYFKLPPKDREGFLKERGIHESFHGELHASGIGNLVRNFGRAAGVAGVVVPIIIDIKDGMDPVEAIVSEGVGAVAGTIGGWLGMRLGYSVPGVGPVLGPVGGLAAGYVASSAMSKLVQRNWGTITHTVEDGVHEVGHEIEQGWKKITGLFE